MVEGPFGFDCPEDSPGLLLWQTTMVWQRLIRKVLEPYGVTHPQFVIMATLLWFEMHPQDTTQIHIVNWTKLDKMTVSKALKSLEGQGLVMRATHGRDTRAVIVRLTQDGNNLIHKVIPVIEALDTAFFAPLGPSDQRTFMGHLKQILSKTSDQT